MSQVPHFGRLFLISVTPVTCCTLQYSLLSWHKWKGVAAARGSRSKRQGTAETIVLCNEALKPKPWPPQRASKHLLTSWRQLGLMWLQWENCCFIYSWTKGQHYTEFQLWFLGPDPESERAFASDKLYWRITLKLAGLKKNLTDTAGQYRSLCSRVMTATQQQASCISTIQVPNLFKGIWPNSYYFPPNTSFH